jgi:hypothetical protein
VLAADFAGTVARDPGERAAGGGDEGRVGRRGRPDLVLVALVPTWGAMGAAWARVAGGLGYLAVILPWLRRMLRQPVAA